MIEDGHILEAIIVFLCSDGWLREQDWEMLQSSDCSEEASGRIALSLGVRARGEKVKTGSNQGVVLEIPW
eukprot:1428873-Heterocapsa_arctica.AAC.1